MRLTLRELSELLECELIGDADLVIEGVAEIQNAGKGTITFITNPRYEKYLNVTKASAVIVGKRYDVPIAQLVCGEPYVAFARVMQMFYPEVLPKPGISSSAVVCDGVELGKDVYVGDNAYVGNDCVIGDGVKIFPGVFIGDGCYVGEGSVIFPNVSVYSGVRIGRFVRIHSGAVIGSDGFGYAYNRRNDRIEKIPQVGSVIIEDFVEIGANTAIDRGTISNTVIGYGTKIDNLVQIGHNVRIGRNCFIVSQVGISGSVEIGNNVTLAGQVGVAGHIRIADGVTVAAKSGVSKSLNRKGTVYGGAPAVPIDRSRKIMVITGMLPEIYDVIKELKKKRGD